MRPAVAGDGGQQSRGAKSAGDRGLPGRPTLARAHRGVTHSTGWNGLGWAVGLAFAVTLAASLAEAQPCPKGTLRIYTSWALQGDRAAEGRGMKNGVEMAVAEAGGG